MPPHFTILKINISIQKVIVSLILHNVE